MSAAPSVLRADPCAYCQDATSATVDHIRPFSAGGRELYNLIGACDRCNTLKGSTSLLVFLVQHPFPVRHRPDPRARMCFWSPYRLSKRRQRRIRRAFRRLERIERRAFYDVLEGRGKGVDAENGEDYCETAE